jgi:hypothetical protein
MTPCLLCSSPAVADGLCVDDGARLWAAERRIDGATEHPCKVPTFDLWRARNLALFELPTPEAARAFLDKLEAARKARRAAPLCSRGCTSHEEER